jgi:transcriptional regulator with XRE-family HTH domain
MLSKSSGRSSPPSPKGLNQVGSYIKAARHKKGMTLRDVGALAERKGISLSYEGFRKIEVGTVTPSDSTLRKISIILDLNFNTLARISRESFVTNQFGRGALKALDLSPETFVISGYWKQLTTQQRKVLLQNMQHMAEFNLLSKTRNRA